MSDNEYFIPSSWLAALADNARPELQRAGIDDANLTSKQVADVLMAVSRLEEGKGTREDAELVARQPRFTPWWMRLARDAHTNHTSTGSDH